MNIKYKISSFILIVIVFFSSGFALNPSELEINNFLKLMNEKLPEILDKHPCLNNQFSQIRILEDGGPSFINSVYLISLKDGNELIIKINNPIWRKNKTLNEVNALKFLKENSKLPIPEVLIYESDLDKSILGYEYIIMPRIAGKPFNIEFDRIYENKVLYHYILDNLASYIADLKKFKFESLGNFIYTKENILEIGGIVDFANYECSIPCKSYSQYAIHALQYYLKEMQILIDKGSQDTNLYQKYIPILNDLISFVDFNILNNEDDFVFSHQDFVMKNILINDNNISAILDWEWSGSALPENESMTGFDFLVKDEDKIYFNNALENLGIKHFFDPPPIQRQLFYQLLGNVYTLVAFREWKEGKLEHTAKFLNQKLKQRKIKSNPNFDMEKFITEITLDLDQCINDFKNYQQNF